MKPATTTGIATETASGDLGRVLSQRERRFAATLLAPAFLALLATTTFPPMFLIWTSTFRMDLAMPFADGFVGLENYRALPDPAEHRLDRHISGHHPDAKGGMAEDSCHQPAPAESDGAVCSSGEIVRENQPTTGHLKDNTRISQSLCTSTLIR